MRGVQNLICPPSQRGQLDQENERESLMAIVRDVEEVAKVVLAYLSDMMDCEGVE